MQEKLCVGDEVFWNDPEGLTSGYYVVVSLDHSDIVFLRSKDGSEVEAFISELT